MKVYKFHPETRLFLGAHECQPSPLEPGKFLFPSNSTEKEPPQCGQYESGFYINDDWKIKSNYFGRQIFSTTTKEMKMCDTFDLPVGYTELDPPENSEIFIFKNGKWEESPDLKKQIEIQKINNDVKTKLNIMDTQSIRSIREYIATLKDTPDFLQEYEAKAKAERARLKTI